MYQTVVHDMHMYEILYYDSQYHNMIAIDPYIA